MQASRLALVLALPLAIVACNRSAPANNGAAGASNAANAATGNASAPAASATGNSAAATPAAGEIQATFRSFERGDHLYAMFDLPAGREAEETVLIRDVELAAFLNAHKGQPLNVVIQTRNEHLDPPGENMDVTSLVSARTAAQTSQQWWQSLSPQQQTAARTEIENLPSSGGG